MHSIRNVASASLVALAAAAGATVVSAAPASASSVTTVKAVETDFHIALSKSSFKPGKYTFVAVNKGQTTHALMITGTGISMAMTKDLSPGQSAKLTVTFKKGAYDIDCPIPGHKALGMNVNITVGGSATTTSKSTSTGNGGSGGYGY
jgi:plastocyanin